jgi:hypothetical protein
MLFYAFPVVESNGSRECSKSGGICRGDEHCDSRSGSGSYIKEKGRVFFSQPYLP